MGVCGVDFFDDDAPSQGSGRDPSTSSSRRPERRRPDRRRTRIQRIAILAIILFVLVFAIALWARSCQHNRKVASYRTYFSGVAAAINDSATQGRALNKLVAKPTQYSRQELIAQLQTLSAKQSEIAVRAGRLAPPSTLNAEQAVFVEGMRVRAQGFSLFRETMLGTLGKAKVGANKLAALAGYFSGPDAYYMSQVYTQARNTMKNQGVTDVAVPTATYYLTMKTFDPARLKAMLGSIGSSVKLTGIHGVGLVSVTAMPQNVLLARGKTASIPASPNLGFSVKVQNQGNVAEHNVTVTAELKLPTGDVLKPTGTIAAIAANQTMSVTVTGFAIPEQALSKVSTLTVTAGPVPGERVKSNNTATYKILLQLK
jgi:hypothetical protein